MNSDLFSLRRRESGKREGAENGLIQASYVGYGLLISRNRVKDTIRADSEARNMQLGLHLNILATKYITQFAQN